MKLNKTTRGLIFICAIVLFSQNGCNKDYYLPVPSFGSDSVLDQTQPLSPSSRLIMEGVYSVISGQEMLGDNMIVKWNRTSLSFASKNGIYFVMNAGYADSAVYIEGYWRDGYSDRTGLCRMYISDTEGGNSVIDGKADHNIIIRGYFGDGNEIPREEMTLSFLRPFSEKIRNSVFYILAHRAGGRSSDHLPASENSIEMIRFTEKLGSTGIEVDVRLTKDNVAFLYHDDDINTRLTMKGPLAGPVSDYSWSQLSSYVRLIHGEKIPALEDALNFVVDSTLLSFVYLDIKGGSPTMSVVIPVQQRILKRALDQNRDLTVVMGISSSTYMKDFMTFPGYRDIPSVCELTVEDTRTINSGIWAPRWTLGTQNDLVNEMHAEGRKVICWTIDNPAWISEYIRNGIFDGLLTNYPFVVAYYHYIQE